jgi:hypothetical protein
MYNIETPKTFIRERVTEIERPDWWPTEEEVQHALKPESALNRPYGEAGKRVNGNGNGTNGNDRANGHAQANGHAAQGARA